MSLSDHFRFESGRLQIFHQSNSIRGVIRDTFDIVFLRFSQEPIIYFAVVDVIAFADCKKTCFELPRKC